MRWIALAITLAGVGALAACSSTKGSAAPPSSVPATTAAPANSSTTATAPTTSTTVPGCTGANYTLSVLGTEGAAGTNELTLGLRNTSSATCRLTGYPGIQFLDSAGDNLLTKDVRGDGESFTDFLPTTVSVASGATVYVNLGYSDVPVGNETTCPPVSTLQVIPPDTTTPLRVPVMLTVCNHGTVDISPVFGPGPETQTTAP